MPPAIQPRVQAASSHKPIAELSEEERIDIVLAAASVLHENGEETSGTLSAAKRLCDYLNISASLIPTWGELFLQIDGDRVRASTAAVPVNTNMNRVVSTLKAVDAICAGQLNGDGVKKALAEAGRAPGTSLLAFVFACIAGAGALAMINGAYHLRVIGIIMFSAGLGALLRRGLAKLSAGPFLQLFAATLVAGAVGAVALRLHLSSPLRIVALGPLLVLVPGPALLSGIFDLAAYRLPLGGARLGHGLLTVLTLSAGVLIGLTLEGATLPTTLPARALPLWLDVCCAGTAAASYGFFFSMPPRMIIYPLLMGMLAHAAHWEMSALGMSGAAATGVACLVVGAVMVPIVRRLHLPFAAAGFASVVSMVPGSILIRMAGGLAQLQQGHGATPVSLINGILSDGTTAVETLIAMTLGLLLPMRIYRYFWTRNEGKKNISPV